MPVNAKFIADFTSFNKAVDQAEVKLRSFQSGAAGVEKALTRVGDSFSGRKVLQEATLAAKAVENIGGVTKLTDSEQRRLNATVTEALAKYKALGMEAPKNLTDLQKATGGTASSMDKFKSSIGSVTGLLATFGVGLSVSAVVGFGKSLLNTADQLVKVADRTGLTTTEVQKLQFIAEQSGNTLDQMTGAVSRLQNGLGQESKGVVGAVKALGLNFDELRRASPFEQMEQVATAIAKVEDPTARATIAMQLFGRSGAEILPSLIADFARLGETAPVMSDKTVRALEKAGDQLNLFKQQITVLAAELYNLAGRAFDYLIMGLFKVTAAAINVQATLIEMAQKIPGMSKVFDMLGVSVADMRRQADFLTEAAKAQGAQLSRVDVEVRKTATAFVDLDSMLERSTGSIGKSERAAAQAAQKYSEFRASVLEFEDAFDRVRIVTDEFARAHAAPPFETWLPPLRQGRDLLKELGMTMAGLPNQAAAAFGGVSAAVTQATGVLGSFKAKLADIFTGMTGGGGFSGLLKNLGGGLIEGFGNILSGGLSSLISKGVGAAIGGLGKLFGIGKSEGRKQLEDANAQIRELQKELLSTHGSIENIIAIGGAAGQELAGAWGSQNAEGLKHFKALIDDFNDSLSEQEKAAQIARGSFADLTDSLDIFGARLDISDAAQTFQTELDKVREGGSANLRRLFDELTKLKKHLGHTPELAMLEEALIHAADTGVFEFERFMEVLVFLKDQYGIAYDSMVSDTERLSEAQRQLQDEFRKTWEASRSTPANNNDRFSPSAFASFEAWKADWLERNPGDSGRIGSALGDAAPAHWTDLPAFHLGGMIDFAKWRRAHRGLAIDEVPIVAQTGEGVLSRKGMAALDALNRGGWGGASGGGQPIVIHVTTELDGRVVARTTAQHLPGVLATMGVRAA